MMQTYLSQEDEKQKLQSILLEKKIVVCCGAGGVGKTTTSAALGVAAARLGRRVLVLTIDPARRLADAMGIPIDSHEPQSVPADILKAEGFPDGSRLDIWMVQPQPVFDAMLQRLASSPKQVEMVRENRLYKTMRQLLAGMQEYMAGESLHQFYTGGDYDLIILDTPPSRSAIDFLKAPDRLLSFLDSRILKVFAPSTGRVSIFGRARRLLQKTFEQVAGVNFFSQAQEFVAVFFDIFESLKDHAETVRRVLASQEASHLLVTSTDEIALEEALYFQKVLKQNNIPFGGFLLNRSLADRPLEQYKDSSSEETESWEQSFTGLQDAFEAFEPLVKHESQLVQAHRGLYKRLFELAGEKACSIAAPHLGEDIEDLTGLVRLAGLLIPQEQGV